MSKHFAQFLCLLALALVLAYACRNQLRHGGATLPGFKFLARRDEHPIRFWLFGSIWALLAAAAAFRAAQSLWRSFTDRAAPVATFEDWLPVAIIAAVFAFFGATDVAFDLWRRGNPITHWKDLRRERELRDLIRSLAADPAERFDGESIKEFAKFAELDWLGEIVVHMSLQSEPRSFARAVIETDSSPEDDEAGASAPLPDA